MKPLLLAVAQSGQPDAADHLAITLLVAHGLFQAAILLAAVVIAVVLSQSGRRSGGFEPFGPDAPGHYATPDQMV